MNITLNFCEKLNFIFFCQNYFSYITYFPNIHSEMQTILVTGGCGFIGSHLINKLLEDENTKIICVDNCSSGDVVNIQQHIQNSRFKFIQQDITQTLKIDESVDQIYHLACPASPKYYQKNHVHTLKTCFIGTLNMLELAHEKRAKFLFTSTSEIYGDPLVHPQIEKYFGNVNPIGPRSCYDEGKRVAESLTINYKHKYDIDVKIVRIFNTYGPNMLPDDGRVVSNFIVQALTTKKLTIYGEGGQTRSFCFVSDTVNGLIKMMNSVQTGPINIGNPDEYTILQLAKIIKEMTTPKAGPHKRNAFAKAGNKCEFVYRPLPPNDPQRRKPDISRARKLLNWHPEISLDFGLKETINYFKKVVVSKKDNSAN